MEALVPASPVPERVTPAAFSAALTMLLAATVLITGESGAAESMTTERLMGVELLPALSLAVTVMTLLVESAGIWPAE